MIDIIFIYNNNDPFLSGHFYDNCFFNLFMKALNRNPKIKIRYIVTKKEDIFDLRKYKTNCFIFFHSPEPFNSSDPQVFLPKIINTDIKTLKLCYCWDCHKANRFSEIYNLDRLNIYKQLNFDYYFYHQQPEYFYKFYPKEFKYFWLPVGIDNNIYTIVKPFKDRKKEILLTGIIDKNLFPFYELRTDCSKLSYINYINPNKFNSDLYVQILGQYQASIATSTKCIVNKYLEIPGAGCLTFMEINDINGYELFNFIDEETAIFINNQNYQEKFLEYINDKNNPKYERIALNGHNFVRENYSTKKIIEKLVDFIKQHI